MTTANTRRVTAFAPAKINLTLHITGQTPNGYHLLDSLVAFADVGDLLTFETTGDRSLTVTGPEAAGVPTDAGNLVLQIAALFWRDGPLRQTLHKDLPSAAGIGGGSADAAATYRAIATLLSQETPPRNIATPDALRDLLEMGADIPMCILSTPARITGIGEHIAPFALPSLPAVLINPRIPVATVDVFQRLNRKTNPPMPDIPAQFAGPADCIKWLATCRNDLEIPARAAAPVIDDVLAALTANAAQLSRMSGSGATCFGLYSSENAAQTAANAIAKAHPNWWVRVTTLGDQSTAIEPRLS